MISPILPRREVFKLQTLNGNHYCDYSWLEPLDGIFLGSFMVKMG